MKKLIIALTILNLMVSQSYSCDGRLFDKYEEYIEKYSISVDCETCGKIVKKLQDRLGDKPCQDDKYGKALYKTIMWLEFMRPWRWIDDSNGKSWLQLYVEYMKVEEICAPDTKRLKARAAVFTDRAQNIITHFRVRCWYRCNCKHCSKILSGVKNNTIK